jgi:hypothetical protein
MTPEVEQRSSSVEILPTVHSKRAGRGGAVSVAT